MIRRVFIAVALTALLASLASAQRGGGGGGGGGGQMGGGGGFPGGFGGRGPQADKAAAIAAELKLNSGQKTAVEAIMDDAQKQVDPLLPQLREQRNAQLQASLGGKDTADATRQVAELSAKMLTIETDAFGKTLAMLDDKQKKNAPKLFDMMHDMFAAPGGWRKSN